MDVGITTYNYKLNTSTLNEDAASLLTAILDHNEYSPTGSMPHFDEVF